MLSIEAIERLQEKINRNSKNDNIGNDLPRMVTALNEAQNKFVEWVLEKKNEDDIRLIQRLNVPSKKITFKSQDKFSNFYSLPDNYFDFANLQVLAKSEACKDYLQPHEIKVQNEHALLFDEANAPSFFFRHTLYNISDNSVRVFLGDFEIVDVFLSYYRYPTIINVEGWTDIDGVASFTSNPEWDDRTMDRVISIAAKDLNINNENLNRIQADNMRIQSEF